MALTTCEECKGQVSSSATACPHCGYPILRKKVLKEVRSISRNVVQSVQAIEDQAVGGTPIDANKLQLIFAKMKKPSAPWTLTRVNGIGLHLGKVRRIAKIDGKIIGVGRLYFTVLFIPILALGWHVVQVLDEESNIFGLKHGSYVFIGKIDRATYAEVFGSGTGQSALAGEVVRGTWSAISVGLLWLLAAGVAAGVVGLVRALMRGY